MFFLSFLLRRAFSAFVGLSSLFLFVRLMRKMQELLVRFYARRDVHVNVNVNVNVTKKNSFSVCAKAGWSFSHLPDECSLCATLFSWLFSLERSRCLCSI